MKFERREENNLMLPTETTTQGREVFMMARKETGDQKILEQFTPEQQREIESKQRILSSLAYFIGKDFRIPVELNEPGRGWHWDFEHNVIRIDPKDLLEKPMDYLRFVIAHEGGHRRISRTDFIPVEEWRQPGFSALMNAIEDPRDNNFVAENYPRFRKQMELAYNLDEELVAKAKVEAKGKLGYQPRFMQASFEYIKQWFNERQNREMKISEDLTEDVKVVLSKTLESAQDSWWRYPTKKEADESEKLIADYAKVSYEINRDEIWPEFKKLVVMDMQDQRSQEFLKNQQKTGGKEGGSPGLPQELKDKLTPEEQKALEEAIDKAIEEAKKRQEEEKSKAEKAKEALGEKPAGGKEETPGSFSGKSGDKDGKTGSVESQEKPEEQSADEQPVPIDLDSLSRELKNKIKEYIDSLPEDKKKELAEKAKKALKEFEDKLNEKLQGKLTENPEEKKTEDQKTQEATISAGEAVRTGPKRAGVVDIAGLKTYKERLEREINKDANLYEEMRREVLPLIDKLEMELRQIFVARKTRAWKTGFETGKRIDIKTRIQEKAQSVPIMESRAWQKREAPQEKDYAISLLVDLSGSMWQDDKIKETFKAVVVLCEVLNRLSINLEILGFNDQMYTYQTFGEQISNKIRELMGGMIKEVDDSRCHSCGNEHNETDLGWATEMASKNLSKQKADNKFLITLSDGKLEESSKHPRDKYDLETVIKKTVEATDINIIGLGVGRGTQGMSVYYPKSIANVQVSEMAEKLSDLIRDVIADYDKI